jgi:hypothetical protein
LSDACFIVALSTLSDSSEIDDDNDLDFDIRKEKVVSSDSDLSDINLPVIEITKHRRKWLRKCVRPIKKMASQVKSKFEFSPLHLYLESNTQCNVLD